MRTLASSLALMLLPQLALAEVCDKIAGDSWIPADGPVDGLTWTGAGMYVAIAAIGFVIARALRSRGLAGIFAIVALLAVGLNVLLLFPLSGDEQIVHAALQEGCWSENTSLGNLARPALLLMLAVAFALQARSFTLVHGKAPEEFHRNGR